MLGWGPAQSGFARGTFGGERFTPHGIAIAMALRAAMPISTAPSGAIVCVCIGRTLVALFLRDQCLPISDRDLVVVGMDFRERQMLPRSCLRLALSKSNSSTRLPRSTTTRVSSGWVASISILSAIGKSHWAGHARALAR